MYVALGANVSPDDPTKVSSADGYEKPTPHGRPDEERREPAKPKRSQCALTSEPYERFMTQPLLSMLTVE